MNSGNRLAILVMIFTFSAPAGATDSVPTTSCASQVAVRADLLASGIRAVVGEAISGKVPGTPKTLDELVVDNASESLSKAKYSGLVVLPKEALGKIQVGSIFSFIRGKLGGEQAVTRYDLSGFHLKDFKLGKEKDWIWKNPDTQNPFRWKIRVPIDTVSVTADLKARVAGKAGIAQYLTDHPSEAKDPKRVKALELDPSLLGPEHGLGLKGLKLTASKENDPKKEAPYVEFEAEVSSAPTLSGAIRIVPGTSKISLPLRSMNLWVDQTPEQKKEFDDALEVAASQAMGKGFGADQAPKLGPVQRSLDPKDKKGGVCSEIAAIYNTGKVLWSVGKTVTAMTVAAKDVLAKQGYSENALSFLYLLGGSAALSETRLEKPGSKVEVTGAAGMIHSLDLAYEKAIDEQVAPMLESLVNQQIKENKTLSAPVQQNISLPGGRTVPVSLLAVGPDPTHHFLVGNLTACRIPQSATAAEAKGAGGQTQASGSVAVDSENPIREGYAVGGFITREDANLFLSGMVSEKEMKSLREKVAGNSIVQGLQLDEKIRDLLAAPPELRRNWNADSGKWELSLEIRRKNSGEPEKVALSEDMKSFEQERPMSAETRTIAVRALEVIDGHVRLRSLELQGLILPRVTEAGLRVIPKAEYGGVELKVLRASQQKDGFVFGVDLDSQKITREFKLK